MLLNTKKTKSTIVYSTHHTLHAVSTPILFCGNHYRKTLVPLARFCIVFIWFYWWLVRRLYEILGHYLWLVRKLCEMLCSYRLLVWKLHEILENYSSASAPPVAQQGPPWLPWPLVPRRLAVGDGSSNENSFLILKNVNQKLPIPPSIGQLFVTFATEHSLRYTRIALPPPRLRFGL